MKHPGIIVAVLLFALVCRLGSSNASAEDGNSGSSRQESKLLKGLSAPSSASSPWAVPDLSPISESLKEKTPSEVDTNKAYELAELVDLAERLNPETRLAWSQAKAAAAAVGLAKSEYYPILAARASAGTARLPVPLPVTAVQASYEDAQAQYMQPALTLEWMLLDFGRRAADVRATRAHLLAANLGFNAHHQQIVFRVQTAFYQLSSLLGRITAAQASLDSALKIQEATDERFKNGLAAAPDVSRARQLAAQAAFDLEEALAHTRDAEVALAESIGVLPTTPIRIVDFSRVPLPDKMEESVEQFINRTLDHRPDLLAKVAALRAREAEVRRAKSAYLPTLALRGEVGHAYVDSQIRVEGHTYPYQYTDQTTWGVGLALSWDIFDKARKHKLEIARAERDAAQHEVEDAKDKAISQVWQYYTSTKLAFRRLDVAAALLEASEKSYQQTFESYQHGLNSLVDVLDAERALSSARYTQLDTRATLLESTAALAYASGDLGDQLAHRKPGTLDTRP
ncbi:MAG TPA: TolC family protein [Candidatus Acidoferrum sp.]|nr:TolC family protein [Candidatus Acidoferrum sp.]